jgi:hypothetical protein
LHGITDGKAPCARRKRPSELAASEKAINTLALPRPREDTKATRSNDIDIEVDKGTNRTGNVGDGTNDMTSATLKHVPH